MVDLHAVGGFFFVCFELVLIATVNSVDVSPFICKQLLWFGLFMVCVRFRLMILFSGWFNCVLFCCLSGCLGFFLG